MGSGRMPCTQKCHPAVAEAVRVLREIGISTLDLGFFEGRFPTLHFQSRQRIASTHESIRVTDFI